VSHASLSKDGVQSPSFQVQLLEYNAEPAIENTGPRLTWILEDLFVAIAKVCVQPFMNRNATRNEHNSEKLAKADMEDAGVGLGDTCTFRKVLDVEVRGTGGW
jgi:tubulin--tyrosine ligase